MEVKKPNEGFVSRLGRIKLRNYRQVYGHMSVNECTLLGQQADLFLADMSVFDPAWQKFTKDRRTFYEYAWLLSCEANIINDHDEHVVWRTFLVGYPKRQRGSYNCQFRDWLRAQEQDITEEWAAYFPIYLRPDEIVPYAKALYHNHKGIDGWLHDFDAIETTNEHGA